MKLEHIGIAVKNLKDSNQLFEQLFGQPSYKVETVESENVSTSFFQVGESKVELLEATGEDSAIAKFIEKKGEGIHHLAFEVEGYLCRNEAVRRRRFSIDQQGAQKKEQTISWFVFFTQSRATEY